MIKTQTNQETKAYIIKILTNLINDVYKSAEIYQVDFQVGINDDSHLYQKTGRRQTLSKTYDIHLEIK